MSDEDKPGRGEQCTRPSTTICGTRASMSTRWDPHRPLTHPCMTGMSACLLAPGHTAREAGLETGDGGRAGERSASASSWDPTASTTRTAASITAPRLTSPSPSPSPAHAAHAHQITACLCVLLLTARPLAIERVCCVVCSVVCSVVCCVVCCVVCLRCLLALSACTVCTGICAALLAVTVFCRPLLFVCQMQRSAPRGIATVPRQCTARCGHCVSPSVSSITSSCHMHRSHGQNCRRSRHVSGVR